MSSWYKKAQTQLAFPWGKEVPMANLNLSPALQPYREEILQYGPEESAASLIDSYEPTTEGDLLFLLQASNEDFQKISFPTNIAPIYIIQNNGDTTLIIEDFANTSEPEEWILNAEPYDYLDIKEENFWAEVPKDHYKLYHGTTEENLSNIMLYGLGPRSETRGISNRDMAAGVFMSATPEVADYSYEVVLEINISQMKNDKYMPRVSGEEPLEENKNKMRLAHYIGYDSYTGDESLYSSDGLSDDTIVMFEKIPAKYLTILT